MKKCHRMSEVLDLCKMSIESTKRLNELFDLHNNDYTEFVDKISDIWGEELFWWTNYFSSRNMFLSEAYKKICTVLLAIEMLEKKPTIKKIIVSNKENAIVLKRYVKQHNYDVDIEIDSSIKVGKLMFCKGIVGCLINIAKQIQTRRIIKKQTKIERNIVPDEMIIIETEVFPTCFSTGEYKARDFENILNYTDEKIFFLPYLLLNTDMTVKELVHHMTKSKRYKFIYRENYLKLIDYFKAAVFPFYCRKYCKAPKVFLGIDVTEIVNMDITMSLYSINSLYGILNYYFVQRIRKKNLQVKSLIGWYEGQPSSLGLFMAFHQNYKGKNSVGYAAYPMDNRWIQLAPTCVQQKYQVVPQKIGVAGQIFENVIKQFVDTVETIVVPPFRMQTVFKQKANNRRERPKKLLVALSYFPEAAYQMLYELNNMKDFFDKIQMEVLLKNHPAKQNWGLKEYECSELNINYKFIDGDFNSVLQESDILLTCMSTTAYETVIIGKPVMIMALSSEILFTDMPSEWEGERYAIVYNSEDIMQEIETLLDKRCELLDLLGNKYLTRADEKTVKILLES